MLRKLHYAADGFVPIISPETPTPTPVEVCTVPHIRSSGDVGLLPQLQHPLLRVDGAATEDPQQVKALQLESARYLLDRFGPQVSSAVVALLAHVALRTGPCTTSAGPCS